MIRILTYTITEQESGMTVKHYLQSKGYSKSVLTLLKKTPRSILRNDVWLHINDLLFTDDELTIKIEETTNSEKIIAVSMPLNIVYEDSDIIVINKPCNMPVHPSLNNYDNTLANALMHYYSVQEQTFVFRCINRIDKDTTGLTIIAKNMLSGAILSRQMLQRQIHRTYLAIVTGQTPLFGTINAGIARVDGSTIERCVNNETGETAITHYKQLTYKNGYSLFSLNLETGRTHQIRVHMKSIGHPLCGDYIYHPEDSTMKRQALHSYQLSFTHPITGVSMTFTAPLPKDMQWILDAEDSPLLF